MTACGGPVDPQGAEPRPPVSFARPLQVYRQLDLLTGPNEFPVVGSVSAVAGAADSTLLLLGLSLPTRALRFQRDGAGFTAGYVVSVRVARDSQLVHLVDRQETVRVGDFAETARSEESVLFQTAVALEPGWYELSVRVRDALSARGFERRDTVAVPRLGPGGSRVARPLLVHRGEPRRDRAGEPRLILNPSHSAPYGAGSPRVYVEAYGDSVVTVEVTSDAGEAVWRRQVTLEVGDGLAAAVVALPPDSLPLGRFWVTVRAGGGVSDRVPLLVTLSDTWLVANFDEVLEYLRYIAAADELASLREGTPEQRRERWDAFWADRDPVPATPVNEFREEFFERIQVAIQQFGEPGRPGWRTDRGEVYIVLGPPTRFAERRLGRQGMLTGEPDAQEWVYDRLPGGGGLQLIFVDRSGFGSYRLTPSSEAAFRSVARRLRESQRTP